MNNRLLNLAIASVSLLAAASVADAVEVLIPSYFYPSGANNGWTQMNSAAASVAITAILNPASGPGPALDTNYRNAVNALRASGGRVIGYVSTSYAGRPIADVKADIAKYKSLYSLDGIFLDEMTNTNNATSLAYYRDLYSYIKSLDPNYRVTANPGTTTQQAYLASPPTADTLVTYENKGGYAGVVPSTWTSAYATRHFSNLVYGVTTSATMVADINAAAAKRVGYIYVTDDATPDNNPWDTLPTYWSAEIGAIRAITPTWAANTSGDWNTAAAWTTSAVPNGVGAEALLFGAITTPQTVFTNKDVTLGVLSFNNANRYVIAGAGSLTMDASVESALIDVRRGNHTINLPLTLHDATIVSIADASSLTIADPLTIASGASLTKTGTGTLAITSLVTDAAAPLTVTAGRLVLDGGSAGSLQISPDASVELAAGGTLTLRHQPSSDSIREQLRSARADGAWTGSGLIAADVSGTRGIGYSFGDAGVVKVRGALNGDSNLDGTVTFADLITLAEHFGQPVGATWTTGDFDYDGATTSSDLNMLQANYGATPEQFAHDWQLAQSLAPEPVGLLTFVGLPIVLRRSR